MTAENYKFTRERVKEEILAATEEINRRVDEIIGNLDWKSHIEINISVGVDHVAEVSYTSHVPVYR